MPGGVNSNPLWVMTLLSAIELYLQVKVCSLDHVVQINNTEPERTRQNHIDVSLQNICYRSRSNKATTRQL